MEQQLYRVCTTHFRWTPDGEADDAQRTDMIALLSVLESLQDFVLVGDFNTPRGGDMFAELANRYKDNVPREFTSSLDPTLHRAAPLERMVDGIFTTPCYVVSDVEMISGISDHRALVANISRISAI